VPAMSSLDSKPLRHSNVSRDAFLAQKLYQSLIHKVAFFSAPRTLY